MDRQTEIVKIGRYVGTYVAGWMDRQTYRTLWYIVSGTVCNYRDRTFKHITVASFLIIP
jgi:hypothetical protein